MDKAKFYNRWTKDALVQRIQALESEIQQRDRQQQHGAAATATATATATPQPGVTAAPAEVSEEAGEDAAPVSRKRQKKLKRQKDRQEQSAPTTPGTAAPSNSSKIDPSKYSTRPVALKLAYLGRNYGGFEFQASSHLPTIEEALWKALVKACLVFPDNPAEVRLDDWGYSKCGRTDRGVSAFGQVIAIRLRSNRPRAEEPEEEVEVPVAAEKGGVKGGEEEVVAGEVRAAETQTVTTEEVVEAEEEPTEADAQPSGEKEKKKKKKKRKSKKEAAPEEEGREFDDFTDEIQYCKVLNRLLPRDIRVLAWCPATPEGFSARHDCRERQYRYFFTQPAYAPVPTSLLLLPEEPSTNPSGSSNNNEKQKPKDGWLDIAAMRDAARRFEGLHDFRNFCKVDPSKLIVNFERRIFECGVVEATDAETALPFLSSDDYLPQAEFIGGGGEEAEKRFPKVYYFHVRGSAFLWHQIRCMVAVLFMVGQGLEEPSVVDRLLDIERQPRRPNYVLANDTPLVLWDCIFPDLSLSSSESESEPPPPDSADDPATTTTTTKTSGSRAPRAAPRNVHNVDAALPWVYVGEDHPGNKHGPIHGLVDDLWATWRERKLDELLAAQLLILAISQSDPTRRLDHRAPALLPYPGQGQGAKGGGDMKRVGPSGGASQRVFEGGHLPHAVGRYQKVLTKATLPSPAEVYEREARRRGYGSAEVWREDIARKREEAIRRAGEVDVDVGVEVVDENTDEVE